LTLVTDAPQPAPPLAGLGDDDLMKLSAAGSRPAFRELVGRYQGKVLGVCLRSAASPDEGREIAQEAFVALWQVAPRYRPSGSFPSFLFTIVRNQLRSAARKQGNALRAGREIAATAPSTAADPDALAEMLASENERRLQAALSELHDVHRRAILLRFAGDMPYEEIAELCNAPVGTVRSWVHHGIKKLRTMLGEAS
jgi:RNA polymerase sigma-70 factor, ECF subfamily